MKRTGQGSLSTITTTTTVVLNLVATRRFLEVCLIVPDFTIFVWSSSFLVLFSLLFSVYFFASYSAFGMPVNRKRKESSENEAKKDIITWTALQRNCNIRNLLDSPQDDLSQRSRRSHGAFPYMPIAYTVYNDPEGWGAVEEPLCNNVKIWGINVGQKLICPVSTASCVVTFANNRLDLLL